MTLALDFDAAVVAQKMADAARAAIWPHFRALKRIENKQSDGAFDPVTEADRAAERAMREVLALNRPNDGIHGEEYGVTNGSTGWTWVLDPIDGTRAFVAGLTNWVTLIGLTDQSGDAVFGVIDQPILDERYIGSADGSFLHQAGQANRLRVSACDDLRQAVISTTDPFILSAPEQGAWSHLRQTAKIIRYGLDAYAYARLAAGTIDLVAESGLAPYDAAALIPIVRGAGGMACDWHGQPAKPGGQLVCASHPDLLEQALIALKRAAT
ncbi:MAG: inositol monophosphatase family protein [Pseudomonadota bacterium]